MIHNWKTRDNAHVKDSPVDKMVFFSLALTLCSFYSNCSIAMRLLNKDPWEQTGFDLLM